MSRMERNHYYIQIARSVAMMSPCSRRKLGAIIVKNGTIVSTGYNGSSRGTKNCGLEIPCLKDLYDEESYKSYVYCPAVHAEQNTIINGARSGVSVLGGTLYLTSFTGISQRPCHRCRMEMINAGLKDCYYVDEGWNLVHEEIKDWIALENSWMDQLLEEGNKNG